MDKIKKFFKETLFKSKKNVIFSCLALAVTLILTVISGISFKSFSNYEAFFWGNPTSIDDKGNPNVTRIEKFSDYLPSLKKTSGDASIYVLEGSQPGPRLLILGGTHPNEPSGQLTATLFLENIKVIKGTVYIITETNRSAYTHSYPQEASPFYYSISTSSGAKRTYKFGSRATNTNDQWPNPDIYVHELTGQKLSTTETRNMNRAYPGKANGTYTEKLAYAVTQLVIKNDISMVIDLHEASPEYLTINAVVAHNRARPIANGIVDNTNDHILVYHTEVEGMSESLALKKEIHAEDSPTNLHGLTHRELGDNTNTLALLAETSNAAQGKYRGAFNEAIITYDDADDKFYEKAAKLDGGLNDGMLYARPVSISERVARHSETIHNLIDSYNSKYTNRDLYVPYKGIDGTYQYDILVDGYTTDTLLAKRVNEGQFVIDYGALFDAELGNDYDIEPSVYSTILYNKVGSFLHDPY